MVQRKVSSKIGIKTHLLKSDNHLVNLKPSSSASPNHENMKKIMKKSRSFKRSDESPPFRNKKTSPNYMKSTSSFDARKEQSPVKTPTRKASTNSKTNESAAASGVKGSSNLKMVRTLTKTPSFKPLRSSKKVIHVDAQRPTCCSTLKESKFPDYLQLNHELDGTSAMKVCPYSYCSLNGHHHAPVPPLKCFLSARRRAVKTQKGFKLGCLSPRHNVKKSDADLKEENSRVLLNGDQDFDIDWEEGYGCDSGNDGLKLQEIDGDGDVPEDETGKKTRLYDVHQELYDEESVSSGAWSEKDGDSASESLCEQVKKINQDYLNYDSFEVLSAGSDQQDGQNLAIGDQNINHQQEETCHESKTVPETNHTTIIYNIIQFNISVFINGEKTDKTVTVQAPATSVAADKMEMEEAMEEQGMSNEEGEVNEVVADEDIASIHQFKLVEKYDNPEQQHHACSQSNSIDEAPATSSDVDQTHGRDEITSETNINTTDCFCNNSGSNDVLQQQPHPCCMRNSGGHDSREFNPRGPNFLPETPDPDAAETVDLRHQMMDERKKAQEWMVDFALQQALTTLAPARKTKVSLLVEAFEKVMPVTYEASSASKAFTNSRPMQACN